VVVGLPFDSNNEDADSMNDAVWHHIVGQEGRSCCVHGLRSWVYGSWFMVLGLCR